VNQAVYSISTSIIYGMFFFVCVMFIGEPDIHDKILELMSKCGK